MAKPIVAVGTMGGTIAMAPADKGGGVSPALGSAELIAAVPELSEIAEIRARSICNVPSPSIEFAHLLAALAFADEMVESGAAGVVLTHGTDTLEESAFFLDLLWDRPEPLILTGAMRSSQMAGADGPSNLLGSVVAATTAELRDFGVLVVLDDEVHLARTVTKSHANAVWTFESLDWGPVARVYEKRARVMMQPLQKHPALPVPQQIKPRIPVLKMGLEESGRHIAAVAGVGVDAIVLAGAGAGHLTVSMADAAGDVVAAGIPVVLATRQGAGTTAAASYDYPGSEMDCFRRGLIGAGYLSPVKARILLIVLTALGSSMAQIKEQFDVRGA
ncbi:MAG: asparaginase [Candidatus Nanopelagicales bacterium]